MKIRYFVHVFLSLLKATIPFYSHYFRSKGSLKYQISWWYQNLFEKEDADEDGLGDACDNCKTIPNPDQVFL